MLFEPDLPAYFERIAYHGPTAPSLANLDALILAHTIAIPFENLDILLGRRVVLDPSCIERKLIAERRGGYCFEQNTYFLHVLRTLGYRVLALSARVRFNRSREETPPRTHVFLRVELPEGSWLVDVGVGGLTPTCALRLALDVRQDTPHEPRRLCHEGEWNGLSLRAPSASLFHQVLIDDTWRDLCEFTLEPMPEIDRELGNWYTSAHPQSPFKSRLTVARVTPDGRVVLNDKTLTRRRNDGWKEARDMADPEELLRVLEHEFGICLPAGTRVEWTGVAW